MLKTSANNITAIKTKTTAFHAVGAGKPVLRARKSQPNKHDPKWDPWLRQAHSQPTQTGKDEMHLSQILRFNSFPQQLWPLELIHIAKQAAERARSGGGIIIYMSDRLFPRRIKDQVKFLCTPIFFFFFLFKRVDNCHLKSFSCRCNKFLTCG